MVKTYVFIAFHSDNLFTATQLNVGNGDYWFVQGLHGTAIKFTSLKALKTFGVLIDTWTDQTCEVKCG